jgi:hypothetical protein
MCHSGRYAPEKQLAGWLQVAALPDNALPPRAYAADAAPRLVVPTARTTLAAGEPLTLRALVLAPAPGCGAAATVMARPLGSSVTVPFQAFPMARIAPERCVFAAEYSAGGTPFADDFEWFVTAQLAGGGGGNVTFPPGAPAAATLTTVVMK